MAQAAAFVFFAAVIPIEVIYAKETLDAGDSGYGAAAGELGGRDGARQLRLRRSCGAAPLPTPAARAARSRSASRYLGLAAAPTLADRLRGLGCWAGAGNGVQWVARSAPCRS